MPAKRVEGPTLGDMAISDPNTTPPPPEAGPEAGPETGPESGRGPHPSQGAEEAGTALTWVTLLARWTDFARASAGFPRVGEGARWRASVAPVIGLQAVTFALGDLPRLDEGERRVGLDLAETLIERHERELAQAWRGVESPVGLAAIVADARGALALATRLSAEEVGGDGSE